MGSKDISGKGTPGRPKVDRASAFGYLSGIIRAFQKSIDFWPCQCLAVETAPTRARPAPMVGQVSLPAQTHDRLNQPAKAGFVHFVAATLRSAPVGSVARPPFGKALP